MTQAEPVPAVHLEQAMIDNTRNDNTETRLKVYQELLFSDLMIALSDPTPDKENAEISQESESGASKINIAIFANPQGLKFTAVFTGPQAVRRWRPEGGHYATLRGQDIFKLLESSPTEVVVINPGSAPIIALSKTEFRQLATGIVPKTTRTPVQVPQVPPNVPQNKQNKQNNQEKKGMQMRFAPDIFKNEQKQHVYDVLFVHDNIAAVSIGLIQHNQKSPETNENAQKSPETNENAQKSPETNETVQKSPDADEADKWVPTIFLRAQNIEPQEGFLKKLCFDVRNLIKENNELFTDVKFEVGIMPDANFWESMNKNSFALFDKNYKASEINATSH